MHYQQANCPDEVHNARKKLLPCHAQEVLGNPTGMLQVVAMRRVSPVVVRIALQGAALLAALRPMGGGIPYSLIVD